MSTELTPSTDPQVASKRALCPHCRRITYHRLHDFLYLPVPLHPGGTFHGGCCYVAMCDQCRGPLIYRLPFGDGPDEFPDAHLAWPGDGLLTSSVPESIQEIYREAHLVQLLSPTSFVIQVRRALEAICSDKGATGNNLQARLQSLVQSGQIPPALKPVSDSLRLLGNIAAHASDVDLEISDTRLIDECFKSLVEFLYILPARHEKLSMVYLEQTTPVADKSPQFIIENAGDEAVAVDIKLYGHESADTYPSLAANVSAHGRFVFLWSRTTAHSAELVLTCAGGSTSVTLYQEKVFPGKVFRTREQRDIGVQTHKPTTINAYRQ